MKLQGQEIDVVRKGSGQPILLLHGGGGPIAAMPFADKLAETFEIIAPTHPGFNGSKIPDHFNRIDDLVFLYLDLLDELDLQEVILMGFSMGGWSDDFEFYIILIILLDSKVPMLFKLQVSSLDGTTSGYAVLRVQCSECLLELELVSYNAVNDWDASGLSDKL